MKTQIIFFITGLITFQSTIVCSVQDAETPLIHDKKESRLKKLICSRYGCIGGVLLTTAAVTAITLGLHPFSSHNDPNPVPPCDNGDIPWCNATHTQTQCSDTALNEDGFVIAPFKIRAYNCHGCTIATETFAHRPSEWLNRNYFKYYVREACETNATVCFEKDTCSYAVDNSTECCSFDATYDSWEKLLLRFKPCNPSLVPACILNQKKTQINKTKIGMLGKIATRFKDGKKTYQSFKRYPKKQKMTQWVNNGSKQRSKKQTFNSGR